MQYNGHLRTKPPRRTKVKDNAPWPVREEKYDSMRVRTTAPIEQMNNVA
jgi:hypothetical protein